MLKMYNEILVGVFHNNICQIEKPYLPKNTAGFLDIFHSFLNWSTQKR